MADRLACGILSTNGIAHAFAQALADSKRGRLVEGQVRADLKKTAAGRAGWCGDIGGRGVAQGGCGKRAAVGTF